MVESIPHPPMAENGSRTSLSELPLEIRLEIYRYLLRCREANQTIRVESAVDRTFEKLRKTRPVYIDRESHSTGRERITTYDINPKRLLYPAILSVSKQIYLEARLILYSENKFCFIAGPHNGASSVIPFLEELSPDSRRLIRTIRLSVNSWWDADYTAQRRDEAKSQFKEICIYFERNLNPSIFWLGGRGTTEGALGLSEGQPAEQRQAAIAQIEWIQYLLPVIRSLESLRLPQHNDLAVGAYLRSNIYGRVERS